MKKFLTICVVVAALCLAVSVNAQSYPPEISGDVFVGDFDGKLWVEVFSVGYSVPGIEGQLYQRIAVAHDENGDPGDAIDIKLRGVWYSPFIGAPEESHVQIGDSWSDEPSTIPWDSDAEAYLYIELAKSGCGPDLWLPRLFANAPAPARRLAAAHDAELVAKVATEDIDTDYRFFAWTWDGTERVWTRRHGYLAYTGSPPQWWTFAAVPFYLWSTESPMAGIRPKVSDGSVARE